MSTTKVKPPTPEGYLSASEAAKFLGITLGSLYVLKHERRIQCEKFFKRLLFKKSVLQAYLTGGSENRFTNKQERIILDIMSRRGHVTQILGIKERDTYSLWAELNKHLKENLALASVWSYKTEAEKIGILTYRFAELKKEERVLVINYGDQAIGDSVLNLCSTEAKRLDIHIAILSERAKPNS